MFAARPASVGRPQQPLAAAQRERLPCNWRAGQTLPDPALRPRKFEFVPRLSPLRATAFRGAAPEALRQAATRKKGIRSRRQGSQAQAQEMALLRNIASNIQGAAARPRRCAI